MYVWDDVVGRHEKRMTRLERRQQIALAVVCVDGAFSRMEEYLTARVPKKSAGRVNETIKSLWEFLVTRKKGTLSEKRVDQIRAMSPGEDDPILARGWGEILDATSGACDMALGEDPKELILDCVSYSYQGVMEMAISTAGRAKASEKDVRNFETKSVICQDEMKFQLECLDTLEAGDQVQSVLFAKYRFPAK